MTTQFRIKKVDRSEQARQVSPKPATEALDAAEARLVPAQDVAAADHRSNSKSATEISAPAQKPKSKFSSSQTDNQEHMNRSSTSNDARAGGSTNEGRWSKFEHCSFLKALKQHGRDWKRVARTVQTRTSTQCRSHAQKFIVSLEK